MKVRRDIASIPKRTARETWDVIVDLITGADSVDVATLRDAASVMQAVITDEHPGQAPIVVKGSGHRLVIYLAFGEAAMDADMDVDPLTWNPTKADWKMTAPAEVEDLNWMNQTLSTRAPRVSVHDVNAPPDESDDDSASKGAETTIDWRALG